MSAVVNQQQQQKAGITKYLSSDAMQGYLSSVIGSNKDKFVTNLVSAVNQNKALQDCTNQSLVSGALVATTLNLSLNSSFGYAYLVPYKNKKLETVEAQFQIGYKGYIQLALRTGEYQRLNSVPIYKSQFVSWNALTEDLKLREFDDFGDDEIIGYVAYFRLNNGFEKTMFWSHEKMMNHADKYSQAFSASAYYKLQRNEIPEKDLWKYSSYWYKDFDGMALKTMLRQLLSKYGIMSEEMQKAYEYDQSVVADNSPSYIDNEVAQPTNDLNVLSQQQKPESTDAEVVETPKDKLFYFFESRGIKSNEMVEFLKWAKVYTDDEESINKFLSDQSGAEAMIEQFFESKGE